MGVALVITMKFFTVVALLGLVGCAVAALPFSQEEAVSSDGVAYLWDRWTLQHRKEYSDPEEATSRAMIFESNVRYITYHNMFMANETGFTMAINKFADMTYEEFKNKMLTHRAPEHFGGSDYVAKGGAPDSKDWRKDGVVQKVKDQGDCGSCWAFSAVAAMESSNALKDKTLADLSEQQVVDCSKSGNAGCDGGDPRAAYDDIIKESGLESEKSYPYKGKDGRCSFSKSKVDKDGLIKSYNNVKKGSEDQLMDAVGTTGPASICVDVEDAFMFYDSGILKDKECRSGWNDLNHCVLAAGYGSENGKDYWLVKNSWGADWGEEGYIRMARNNKNMCGIATEGTLPVV